jgi:hypothetical protein
MKALLLVLSLLSASVAYAAEPVTLTCQGTVKHGIPGPGSDEYPGKQHGPEPASMTIILNFTTGEVEVPGLFIFPIKIKMQATDADVTFNGIENIKGSSRGFMGKINRLTGETEAHKTVVDNELYSTTIYALKCTPTKRMF